MRISQGVKSMISLKTRATGKVAKVKPEARQFRKRSRKKLLEYERVRRRSRNKFSFKSLDG